MPLATVPEAVEDFKVGKFVIVVDDEDRENEGDLVVAAEKVTPDHVSFMTHHGSGLVCLPVKAKRLDELGIAPMVERNTSRLGTAFSVSIDARDKTTTGAFEAMPLWAGESVDGVKRLQKAGEIVRELAEEAEKLLRTWGT